MAKVTPVGLLMWSTRLSMGPCMAVTELKHTTNPMLMCIPLLLFVSMCSPGGSLAEDNCSGCTETKSIFLKNFSITQGMTLG